VEALDDFIPFGVMKGVDDERLAIFSLDFKGDELLSFRSTSDLWHIFLAHFVCT
jgi:hypothetical protein